MHKQRKLKTMSFKLSNAVFMLPYFNGKLKTEKEKGQRKLHLNENLYHQCAISFHRTVIECAHS